MCGDMVQWTHDREGHYWPPVGGGGKDKEHRQSTGMSKTQGHPLRQAVQFHLSQLF